MPNFDRIWADCPHATLITFGPDVGLPTGQMGNSEVGHTNIGAGRVVAMDLGAIDLAIEDGTFFRNPGLLNFIDRLKASGGTAHLMGVVSDGGVHGHILHLLAAVRALSPPQACRSPSTRSPTGATCRPRPARASSTELDGRPARRARASAPSSGRYYAMDRDNRWERVARAYDAIVHAEGRHGADAAPAVAAAYARDETDEFIAPTVIDGYTGASDGDGLFCLNFRADRAREILSALGDPGFADFDTGTRPALGRDAGHGRLFDRATTPS